MKSSELPNIISRVLSEDMSKPNERPSLTEEFVKDSNLDEFTKWLKKHDVLIVVILLAILITILGSILYGQIKYISLLKSGPCQLCLDQTNLVMNRFIK